MAERRPRALSQTLMETIERPAAEAGPVRPSGWHDFYGLSKAPFEGHPDTAFILFGSHRRAFERVADHMVNRAGLLLLQADAGAGKTALLRAARDVAVRAGIPSANIALMAGAALSRERLIYKGETLELPLPDGPGKALKLTIAPKQAQIPLYLAAIGPNNTALAGEIADGWLPTFFSPEHVGLFRPLLAQGAARSGRSLDGFQIAPTVSVHISDDIEAARNFMRPALALYIGGMGSRDKNFYNTLVQQYGLRPPPQRFRTFTWRASASRHVSRSRMR